MRMLPSLWWVVLVGSCAHPAPVVAVAPPVVQVEAPAAPPPDVLVLERTACSGTCPVYRLTLQPDGHVHFAGVRDVAAVGERDWRIEPAFAKHLFGEFDRAGFAALAPRYSTEVEEFPGLALTVTRAGVTHRVQLGGEGSAELPRDKDAERLLNRLATTVDKLTASGRFVETDSKKKSGGCVE